MIEWRKTEYDGYEVSQIGEIRSIDRCVIRSDTGTSVRFPGVVLVQAIDNCGYLRTRVSVNGKQTTLKVHRVVAMAFIPNPDNLPQVNHIDGNKENNKSENLEWVNNSQNQLHAIDVGLRDIKFAKEAPSFTGSVQAFNKDGTLAFVVSGNKEMREKGLDFRLVSACLHGKRHTHRGYTFKKLEKEQDSVIKLTCSEIFNSKGNLS